MFNKKIRLSVLCLSLIAISNNALSSDLIDLSNLSNGKSVVMDYKNEKVITPKLSYLLLSGQEQEAIQLIKTKKEEPFQIFTYKGNETSDVIIALENNLIEYLKEVLPMIKDRINKPFFYNGEDNYYLLINVASTIDKYTAIKTKLLLENGALEDLKTKNGYTSVSVAKEVDNLIFLSALYDFKTNLQKTDYNILEDNVVLLDYDKKIQDSLVNELKNGKLDAIKNDKDIMYEYFIKMIKKGYNDAADILLTQLQNDPDFNINKQNSKGLTPLMATALSIDGGNVEYFKKLIHLGANPNQKTDEGFSMTMVSVANDSFKIFYQLLRSDVKILEEKYNEKNIMDYALSREKIPQRVIFVVDRYLDKVKNISKDI